MAKLTDTEFRIIKDLNPELKTNMIPPGGYTLRVPFKCGEIWAAKKDSIYDVIAQLNPAPEAPKDNGTSPITKSKYNNTSSDKAPSGTVLLYHTVRSGEVVGKIAEKYHVSASSISRWNNLRRYRIRVGQKLKIYAPARYASSAKSKSKSTTKSTPVKLKPGQKYHTVPVSNK